MFLINCKFLGDEEYITKDEQRIVVLHKFVDHAGNIFKFGGDYTFEVGQRYDLSLVLGRNRKGDAYWKFSKYEPVIKEQ